MAFHTKYDDLFYRGLDESEIQWNENSVRPKFYSEEIDVYYNDTNEELRRTGTLSVDGVNV